MMRIILFLQIFIFVQGFTLAPIRKCGTPPLFSLKTDDSSDALDAEDVIAAITLPGDEDDRDWMLKEGMGIVQETEVDENSEDNLEDDELSEDNLEDDELPSGFLDYMEEVPAGKLTNDDFTLLRDTMQQLSTSERENVEETAHDLKRILNRMLNEYAEGIRSGKDSRIEFLVPTAEDFLMVKKAWLKTRDRSSAKKVTDLFFEQEDIFESTGLCKPTLENVQTVLDALGSSHKKGADRTAKALIERLPNFQLSITSQMYTSLITCIARDKSRGAASRAEKVLEEAIEVFPPDVDKDGNYVGMTVDAFNVVITAWAKSDLDSGPDNARNLLLLMETVDAKRGILKPTVSSFTSLIDAYAQKNTWEGGCEAERTLNALLNEYLESGDETLEPNIATFGIVLSSWGRLSRKGSTDAPANAAKILLRMEDLFESARLSFAPDAIAYITVLRAWANSKDTNEGPARAEAMLDEMNECYLDGDDTHKPSSKSVRTIVEAWSKSERQDAMFKAEELLEKYDEFLYEEDEIEIVKDIFKSLIFGWCKNFDPEKAHENLLEMIDRGLKPDSYCFDRVIEAYTQEDFPSLEQVKSIFEVMEKCSLAGDIKPNERVYTSFIRALSKAKVPMLANKARTVLERMKMLYEQGNEGIRPTVFTYNAVLHACASSHSEDDASTNIETFKVALNIFNNLRAEKEPLDHVTFSNMLRCAALLPQGSQREAMIATTFDLCCRLGFVNPYVIRDLRLVADEGLWRDLCKCPEGDVDVELLPSQWTKRSKRDDSERKPKRRKKF